MICGETDADYCITIPFVQPSPTCQVAFVRAAEVCIPSQCTVDGSYYDGMYFAVNVDDCAAFTESGLPSFQTTLLVYPTANKPIGNGYPEL
jgi:hypothetical protein